MARTKLSLEQRLAILENQKQELLTKRAMKIGQIFKDFGGTNIEDEAIIGFIRFASNPENLDSTTLIQLKEDGSKRRKPRRKKN